MRGIWMGTGAGGGHERHMDREGGHERHMDKERGGGGGA